MTALFLWLVALPLAIALFYFSAEVLLGLRAKRPWTEVREVDDVAVIIPAHNEALGIAATVRSVLATSPAISRIVVVADNCSDKTAEEGRAAGGIVIERNEPHRRGKGHALAHARSFLASDPPTAVFVLDADCRIERGSPQLAAYQALALNEPVQSRNLLVAPATASPLVRLSNFAFLLKNLVRARGLYRLGGGVTLSGTGMAFPWSVFFAADLATSNVVEDLALSLNLAFDGKKVHLCEEVEVNSLAAESRDSLEQRRRWEFGFISQAAHSGLPLLRKALTQRSKHLGALGMHLLVPPLALLILASVIAIFVALAFMEMGGSPLPAFILLGALCSALGSIVVAWWVEGRSTLSAWALLRAPVYLWWKVPLYIGLLRGQQTEWKRTRRFNEKR